MERDNYTCLVCGRSLKDDPKLKLEVHHNFPWSKGGETFANNLATLCKRCHAPLGDDYTVEEFYGKKLDLQDVE